MTIRLAVVDDRAVLLRMCLRFAQESGYRAFIAIDFGRLEALVDFVLEHGAAFVCVNPLGLVVGMLGVTLIEHPMSGECVASEMAWWIEPEYRGGTTALRMLTHAETWARELGATRFQMVAPAGSTLGLFYQRRGYRELESTYQRSLA